jgi:glucokinase
MNDDYAIGVDLGGTNLRAAAVNRTGSILAKITANTQLSAGRDAIVNDIATAIQGVKLQVDHGQLAGVGIGIPGYIDIATGVVLGSANLPDFTGFAFRDAVQRQIGIPIILENDANAAALGEQWIGAGRGVKDLVLLTLGTGIGGGIIVDGKILHGFLGMAGELGHMTVIPDGNPCGCGNYGCLERHAAATAIVGMGRALGLGDQGLTAEEVYQMAVAGNERAKAVFESMGRALGMALANLVNIFNFPLFLLSGGMLPAWDVFAPAMFEQVRKRSFSFVKTNTKIEKATLGNLAGLIGAAYLPFQEQPARASSTNS